MILAQWSCEVPLQNREKFIRFATTDLKTFYESKGALRYELLFPTNTEKKYFSYHTTENENIYVEQLLFESLTDFEKLYDIIEQDKEAQYFVGRYVEEFGISNCQFKILKHY
ncbi:MAG: hypothetical protein ACFFEY_12485 [Candidatus Thorarchaeota archaeon]